MNSNLKINLNKQFPKNALTGIKSDELDALLHTEFSSATVDIENSCVIYGDKREFYITYRKGSSKIIKLEATKDLTKLRCENICRLIRELLIEMKGDIEITSEILFARQPFKASFRYKDLFTLTPVSKTSPQPEQLLAPHPLVLYYKYVKTNHNWLDQVRKINILQEIINLISFLTEGNIYYGDKGFAWVITDNNTSELKQLGYLNNDALSIKKLPEVPESSHPLYPNLHTKLLDTYFNLDETLKSKFIVACSWYNEARTAPSPEMKYLNYIIVIENLLIKRDEKITKKFKSIMEEYTGVYDQKLYANIYDLRSSIVHQGKRIYERKINGIYMFSSAFETEQLNYLKALALCCERLLINWLKKADNANYKIDPLSLHELYIQAFEHAYKLQWSFTMRQ